MSNKRSNTLLENEINRYRSIMSYNDNTINETVYSFYNEAEDEAPVDDSGMPPQNQPGDVTTDPAMGGTDDVANQIATAQPGEVIGAQDQAQPADPNAAAAPVDPAMGTDAAPVDQIGDPNAMGGNPGGDVEIDVTSLVQDTQNVLKQTERALNRLQMVYDRLGDVDTKLMKMDSIINQMGQIEKQIELMRPPTEAERRRALADKSYPYSVTDSDYLEGVGYKNQTAMEKKPNKLSMMDNLMSNYDPNEIKKSFNIDDDKDKREGINF